MIVREQYEEIRGLKERAEEYDRIKKLKELEELKRIKGRVDLEEE